MALTHAFISPAAASSDATKVDGPKWNGDHLVDSGGVDMASSTAGPSAPASSKLRFFAQEFAGRSMAAMRASVGAPTLLQSSFARGRIGAWRAVGNTTTITTVGVGITAGSPVARIVTTANFFNSLARVGYVPAATANANSTARGGGLQFFFGNAPNMGGFFNVWRFGTAAYVSDARVFLGLGAANASYGSTSPNTLLNFVGIGFDPGDTTWSIYSNDGGGLPTKITLDANFPCNTNSVDVIELALYAAPNSSTLYWQVTNVTTGVTATGTLSGDLPAANSTLQPHISVVNGASAVAVGIDFMSMYIETES